MTEAAGRPPRVVFVCVENSNRSQMAEAFTRQIGGGRVEAYSAGSRPCGRVNPDSMGLQHPHYRVTHPEKSTPGKGKVPHG